MLVLTVIFVVVLVSVVLAMEKVGMNLPLELVQLRALIVTVATNLANVASAKVLEKPKNFTQKRYITNPLCCTPGFELRSAEREQWQGEHTTIGRKSEWIILGSLLTEVLSICFSRLRSNMLTANYCRAATASASPFIRKNATLKKVSRLCG